MENLPSVVTLCSPGFDRKLSVMSQSEPRSHLTLFSCLSNTLKKDAAALPAQVEPVFM